LKIQGTDLLQFEKNNAYKLTGKKLLWKDPAEKNIEMNYYEKNYIYCELVKQTKIK